MDLKSYNPELGENSLNDRNFKEPPLKNYGVYHQLPKKPKKKINKPIIGVVAIIIVIVLSLLIFSNNKKPAVVHQKIKKPVSHLVTNQTYNSVSSALSFTYPNSWNINDNGKGLILITSPIVSLTSDLLTNTKGKIVISINQQSVLPSAFGNYSEAVSSSTAITYNNPTAIQRNQTYLTYVQYPSTNISGGLDSIFVTGGFGYQKLQVIPASDIVKLNPIIIISFESCQNKSCTKVTPLTVSSKMITNSLISNQAIGLIKSLKIN